MFNKKTKEERPGLDKAIDAALAELNQHDPGSERYASILEHLKMLYALQIPSPEPAKPVSLDTVLVVTGNLVGIGMILGYERAHVITSKALSFVIKSKM